MGYNKTFEKKILFLENRCANTFLWKLVSARGKKTTFLFHNLVQGCFLNLPAPFLGPKCYFPRVGICKVIFDM